MTSRYSNDTSKMDAERRSVKCTCREDEVRCYKYRHVKHKLHKLSFFSAATKILKLTHHLKVKTLQCCDSKTELRHYVCLR